MSTTTSDVSLARPDVHTLAACPCCALPWTYMVDCSACAGTGADPDTGEACSLHSCAYNPKTGKYDGRCTAHCCQTGQRGPFRRIIGVQYAYDSPAHYDGVSEWRCPGCETRWGRWTGRVLGDGDAEHRFGGRAAR